MFSRNAIKGFKTLQYWIDLQKCADQLIQCGKQDMVTFDRLYEKTINTIGEHSADLVRVIRSPKPKNITQLQLAVMREVNHSATRKANHA